MPPGNKILNNVLEFYPITEVREYIICTLLNDLYYLKEEVPEVGVLELNIHLLNQPLFCMGPRDEPMVEGVRTGVGSAWDRD